MASLPNENVNSPMSILGPVADVTAPNQIGPLGAKSRTLGKTSPPELSCQAHRHRTIGDRPREMPRRATGSPRQTITSAIVWFLGVQVEACAVPAAASPDAEVPGVLGSLVARQSREFAYDSQQALQ